MKHHRRIKKLGRVRKQRVALMRSLAISLIERRKIETTEGKAKALRPFVERLVTLAKQGTIPSRRLIDSRLGGAAHATKELVETIAPAHKERPGGYTRIIKTPPRSSDAGEMALIEFTT